MLAVLPILAFLTSAPAEAKAFVLPHVFEASPPGSALPSFHTVVHMSYFGGVAGAPAGSGGAVASLFLYDASTNKPLEGASGTVVCNPCSVTLDAAHRTADLDVAALVDGAGGPLGGISGRYAHAVLVVSGDEALVNVRHSFAQKLGGVAKTVSAGVVPVATDARLRIWGDPHVTEREAVAGTDPWAVDTRYHMTLAGPLAGISAAQATVRAYLFEEDGKPLESLTGAAVCNPCTYRLSAQNPDAVLDVAAAVDAAGGFATSEIHASLLVVASGKQAGQVAVQGLVVNAHTSPLDLSVFGFQPEEIKAATP